MEEFFDIPGYDGFYQMDKNGNARSVDRWVDHPINIGGRRFVKGKKLKVTLDNHGYLKIGLCKNNYVRNIRIHVLLGKMFIPNPNNHPLIRHLNDIKTDNRLSNLSWGTDKDNAEDCVKNGNHVHKTGKDHHWYGHKTTWNKGKGGIYGSRSKLICDLETGIFYHGCREAGDAKNINENTLRAKLCGLNDNNTRLVYA